MFRGLTVVGMGALVALWGIAGAVVADAASPPDSLYRGKAAALVPATDLPPPGPFALRLVQRASTPITQGARIGMVSVAGADYVGPACPPDSQICQQKGAALRVMVFKTSAAAQAYWKQSCPSCGYRKDQAGWPFWIGGTTLDPAQPSSPTNVASLTVALCKNVVIPVKGVQWGGTYARASIQMVVDAAERAGMRSCDPLKQEPTSDVFARGISNGRGKAAAVGTIKNPSRIFLRVRYAGYDRLYVKWTLTCTNGTRTETTTDEGLADTPLYVQLPIGISGARSCSASASATSDYPSNVTISVELLNKP